MVEIDGTSRHLHANFLRPYQTRINSVIYDVSQLFSSPAGHTNIDQEDENTAMHQSEARCASDYGGIEVPPLGIRVNGCSVINDSDIDFGAVETVDTSLAPPTNDRIVLPSEQINPASLSHLTDRQRTQLLDLLDRFSPCFSVTPYFVH